jgi:DNA-binding transcriptional LysR family regulator
MDRLDAMTTLVSVVNERSFAAAGRKLGLPRAVVSNHVRLLETEYGVRFFHRTTRRVSLTDAGARFHGHCLKVIAALSDARQEVEEHERSPRGVLRMTAPAAFSELYLMRPLEQFAAKQHGVTLDVDYSERFVDFVREGFDIGIRIGTSPPPGLVVKRVATSSLLICASPAYVARRGAPADPDDLRAHDCIGYVHPASPMTWDFGGASQRRVTITPTHRTNGNRFLRHLVLEGHGLAQLPSYLVADDLEAGRLVSVLDTYRDTTRSIIIVYQQGMRRTPKVRAMIDHLAATLTPLKVAFAGHLLRDP